MMESPKTYVCDSCGETFENEDGWSDEDATKEYEAVFHEKPTAGKDGVVCDDCYKAIMGMN